MLPGHPVGFGGLIFVEYDEQPGTGHMMVSPLDGPSGEALHTDDDGTATALLDEYASHVEQCNSEAYEEYVNEISSAPEGTFPAFTYHPIFFDLVSLPEIKAMAHTSSSAHPAPSPTTLECIR